MLGCDQDEEINNQSQLIEKLREQMLEQEELIAQFEDSSQVDSKKKKRN